MEKQEKLKKAEEATEIFKALSNKTRLLILCTLLENDCNVSELVDELHIPQSTVSQHLSIMRNKGIIKGQREGAKVCYQIVNDMVLEILELIRKIQSQ